MERGARRRCAGQRGSGVRAGDAQWGGSSEKVWGTLVLLASRFTWGAAQLQLSVLVLLRDFKALGLKPSQSSFFLIIIFFFFLSNSLNCFQLLHLMPFATVCGFVITFSCL